jgi:threonine synthase
MTEHINDRDPQKEDPNFVDSEKTRNIMDGANGEIFDVFGEVDDLAKIARNEAQPLEVRLEAYEDIIDSEVGDTSLVRARNIEREVGVRQIYLKFEGGNPTGTQKDRSAFAQAMDALRRGFDTITLATCGNYGSAMALAASLSGLRCLIFIPQNFHTGRIREMKDLGAEIVRISGDYETAVMLSAERASKDELYDANPGGDNTSIQLRAYGQIAYEIYDELRDAPLIAAVPVSNGTTLAGIYKGFLSLYRRGKTSRIPRIVAGSSYRKNPVVQAYLKGSASCVDLNPEKIRETRINEPLINWHAIDGDHALEAIRQTNGWATNASDKNMRLFSRLIREKEGLQVLPASTAGIIGLLEKHRKETLPNDRFVVVLTGRKS